MGFFVERARGIEPPSSPWEGDILPVYYARRQNNSNTSSASDCQHSPDFQPTGVSNVIGGRQFLPLPSGSAISASQSPKSLPLGNLVGNNLQLRLRQIQFHSDFQLIRIGQRPHIFLINIRPVISRPVSFFGYFPQVVSRFHRIRPRQLLSGWHLTFRRFNFRLV